MVAAPAVSHLGPLTHPGAQNFNMANNLMIGLKKTKKNTTKYKNRYVKKVVCDKIIRWYEYIFYFTN